MLRLIRGGQVGAGAGAHARVGAEAVVEVPDHLGFVKRQVASGERRMVTIRHSPFPIRLHKPIPHQPVPLRLQLRPRAEEMRVVGHVKHAQEANAPRIGFGELRVANSEWLALFHSPFPIRHSLVHQHRHAAVDGFRQFGILTGAEDGHGASVGVDAGQVLGGEGEAPPRVAQVLGAGGEEDKLHGRVASSEWRMVR